MTMHRHSSPLDPIDEMTPKSSPTPQPSLNDISNYDINNGSSIVLADYTSIESGFGTFNPTVDIIAGDSGLDATLSFDTATHSLVLTVF